MKFDRQAMLEGFRADSEEELTQMEEALLALEARPGDEELLGTIFRVAHSLKGNAALLGLDEVTELAHELESTLDPVRQGEKPLTKALVTLLLESIDVVRAMLPVVVTGQSARSPRLDSLLERLRTGGSVEPEASAPLPTEPPPAEADAGPALTRRTGTLRVTLDRLDRMLDLSGEIAIAHGQLGQLIDSGVVRREALLEAHRELDRLFLDMHEMVLRMRMVPIAPVFQPHVRAVRDLGAALGKQVQVTLVGSDVEVDTSVVEHLRDPLTHMVRNAVDHGIEPPDVRRSRGKDPCGHITLAARCEAGRIVVEVRDDGAGLDRARIAARVRDRGLHPDPEHLEDGELFAFIFEPGFSTAEAVTEISGRGVGMDVVKRNVEALRGSLTVESKPGHGTSIEIRLPLTLAILQGFHVDVADETFIVPIADVLECIELPRDVQEASGGRGILNLRGEALPFLRLAERFGLERRRRGRESVVVVGYGDRKAGLAVDALLGEGQTVIKPLGKLFRSVMPGISGSAVLGSGRVALIVDVPALLQGIVRPAEAAA